MKIDTFVKYMGWLVSIVISTVAFLNYFNAPTLKNSEDITAITTKVETLKSQSELFQETTTRQLIDLKVKTDKTATDVAWIRGALSNIGIKAPSALTINN